MGCCIFSVKKVPSTLCRRLGAVQCTSTTLSASVFTSSSPDAHFREFFTFSPDPLEDDVSLLLPSPPMSPCQPGFLTELFMSPSEWPSAAGTCADMHTSDPLPNCPGNDLVSTPPMTVAQCPTMRTL